MYNRPGDYFNDPRYQNIDFFGQADIFIENDCKSDISIVLYKSAMSHHLKEIEIIDKDNLPTCNYFC